MPLLAIQQNSAGSLVALQQPQSTTGYIVWVVLGVVVVAGLAVSSRRWWVLVVAVLLAALMIPWRSSQRNPAYKLVLDKTTGEITSITLRNGTPGETVSVPAKEISSAEMQFNRGATRIALVKRDGQILFPLGEQHLQGEQDQYVVLSAIREMIGQTH